MVRTPSRLALMLLLSAAGLSACEVGPNYHRPASPTPPAFKEAEGWTPAQPSDAADRADWWTVFNDATLDDLERQVEVSNQNLAAAEAAYRQAHASVAEQRAALFPSITLNGSADVSGSGGRNEVLPGGTVVGGTTGSTGSTSASSSKSVSQTYRLGLGATWEPDLWGAIRRTIENAKANAQASAADLANARLSAQTEVAADYIQLRELDEEKRLLDATVDAYARTLTVTQNKYAAGTAARSDVRQAETQLYGARGDDTDLIQQRARLEHAIAVLVGKPPADLTIAPAPWTLKPVDIPPALPSTLIERRPDVAGAERRAAAASATIGVQTAGYFPSLNLSGSGGVASSAIGQLFSASSTFWTVGASVAQTIFDAGATRARVAEAKAAFDEAVANYRQSVLTAFGQVEDNLAAQRVLAAEQADRQGAYAASADALRIVENQYRAGTIDYTSVVVAQTTALSAQRTELAIEASRLTTTVDLIAALGGGWTSATLPRS